MINLLIALAVLAGLYFGIPRLFDLWWYSGIPELKLHSDVPVVRDLVYAPRSPEIEVLEMTVKGTQVARERDWAGCRFVLQAKLRCRVKGAVGVHSISCAQITARQVKIGDFGEPSVADVEIRLQPALGDRPVVSGEGEVSLVVEDILHALGMGENIYRIRCGDQTGTVVLYYDPKSRTGIQEEKPSKRKPGTD